MAEEARRAAIQAEQAEERRQWSEAAAMHREAARLFRLVAAKDTGNASTSSPSNSNNSDVAAKEQLRMLARHHDSRVRVCDLEANAAAAVASTTNAKKQLQFDAQTQTQQTTTSSPSPSSVSSAAAAFNVFSPQQQQQHHQHQQQATWAAQLLTPLENLLDRLFPKDSHEDEFTEVPFQEQSVIGLDDDYERDEAPAGMMTSFYVLPDYEKAASPVRGLPSSPPPTQRSESAILSQIASVTSKSLSGSGKDVEESNAQLRVLVERLMKQNEALSNANRMLSAKVTELQQERRVMRESVAQFRQGLEKSMLASQMVPVGGPPQSMQQQQNQGFLGVSFIPTGSAMNFNNNNNNNNNNFNDVNNAAAVTGLDNPIDFDSRSALMSSRSPPIRSPSPDLAGYIRELEKKVEDLQLKNEEYAKYFKQLKRGSEIK